MKRAFFFILFLWILLVPSVAGCAEGRPRQRARSMDAGSVFPTDGGSSVPPVRDSGMDASVPPPGGLDAGRAPIPMDAGSSVLPPRDAGRPDAPVTSPDAGAGPEPGESHLLRIALGSSVRALCPAGWRLRLWLTDPPVESTRGLDLELHIPDLTYFGPWSSFTLWCDERVPQWYVWDAEDHDALGSGAFSELSLDGIDFRSSTRLCEDPLSPGTGFRPILMWGASRRGSCPP